MHHPSCVCAHILYLLSCCHELLVALTDSVPRLTPQNPPALTFLGVWFQRFSLLLHHLCFLLPWVLLISPLTCYYSFHLERTKQKPSSGLTSSLIHFPHFSPSLYRRTHGKFSVLVLWFFSSKSLLNSLQSDIQLRSFSKIALIMTTNDFHSA